MRSFIHNDFLLNSAAAVRLYHQYAENQPILDYHCHLDAKAILEDKRFNDLTELWLGEDHYKWRLLRANGVEEKYITGNAEPFEKFMKWAETMPKCIGNPLYHWTHLELSRCFGINDILSPGTARGIWEECSRKLSGIDFSARSLIMKFKVKALCTTDDPADDLKFHIELSKDSTFPVKVLPAFRPEKAVEIEGKGFANYIRLLSEVSETKITSFGDLVMALKKRAKFFKIVGCMVSDLSVRDPDFTRGSLIEAQNAFLKAMQGESLTPCEINAYKTQMIIALGKIYHSLGFVMQIRFGVIRNNNTRMYRQLGADAGFDSIGDGISAVSLAAFLDELDKSDELPKTVVYCLNDTDNAKIASVIGCFQGEGYHSKVQIGSAWWFNDHIDGMRRHLKTLGNIGLLSNFIGMLTDSRSFLSYPRHEYFRRILCDLIGGWAENGEVPMDDELLGGIVRDICYSNASRFFGITI